MLGSAFAFSIMSLLVKVTSEHLPTGEIVLARGVVTMVASYVMVVRAGLPLWGTNRRGPALRGVLGFGGLSFYFLSIAHLPLADATTIQAKMKTLRTLGVPYADDEIAKAPEALKDRTELDALIAYLQGLGLAMRGAK